MDHAAALSPRTFYSQHGEDALIAEAFSDVAEGYFVEVGCIDGRRASNTLMLEELGWTGCCVEAHEDYVELVRRNRPRSRVLHCAVGDRDAGEIAFYSNARGSLSTLDRSLGPEFARRYGACFHGFVEKRVRMRTISSILDEIGAAQVHVMSIDIEGCDHLAVRGLDLGRHRPELLIVEAGSAEAEREIDAKMLGAGYLRGVKVAGCNVMYFRERERLARLAGRRFRGESRLTAHPMDDAPDDRVPFTIDVPPLAA
ncbi:MAG: FkbM family methyltransferase [Planctomycetota bacterium]|nr:FkbM family methyltransferase [Planctomycetota bacterium]